MTTPTFSRPVIEGSYSIVIYRITSPSGAVYIGQSHNLNARLANYRSVARGKGGNSQHQKLLARSLLRYGFSQHQVDVLHRMPSNTQQCLVDNYERYAIQIHKLMGLRLLNLTAGGRGTAPHPRIGPPDRPDVQGANHPLAKLTEPQVRLIRQRRANGETYGALAKEFGVHNSLISLIVKGRAWAHVIDEVPNQQKRFLSKLTRQDANTIRSLYASGAHTHRSLANLYYVDHGTIRKIINNPEWGRRHAREG